MKQRWSILSLILSAAAALPALAGTAHYAITAEQVAAAVNSQGAQISPDQIALLTGVVANVAAPRLTVKSIDRMGPERAVARLECADTEQCLPFIVSIRLNTGANSDVVSTLSRSTPTSSQTRPAPIVVRAGSPTILLLNGPHVQITLGVICLDNGAVGQTIRATDRDRRQIFTAHVMQGGVLEGRL
jgi:hypothetical protein